MIESLGGCLLGLVDARTVQLAIALDGQDDIVGASRDAREGCGVDEMDRGLFRIFDDRSELFQNANQFVVDIAHDGRSAVKVTLDGELVFAHRDHCALDAEGSNDDAEEDSAEDAEQKFGHRCLSPLGDEECSRGRSISLS